MLATGSGKVRWPDIIGPLDVTSTSLKRELSNRTRN